MKELQTLPLYGVYPERDSSVALLSQNDIRRRVQGDNVGLVNTLFNRVLKTKGPSFIIGYSAYSKIKERGGERVGIQTSLYRSNQEYYGYHIPLGIWGKGDRVGRHPSELIHPDLSIEKDHISDGIWGKGGEAEINITK